MKKVLFSLMMIFSIILNADSFYGADISTGKSNGDHIQAVTLKAGYQNDTARFYATVSADKYKDESGDAKGYGIEFDKKIGQAYIGFFGGFGKKDTNTGEVSTRDHGARVGYALGEDMEIGVKYTARNIASAEYDRFTSVFIGVNF